MWASILLNSVKDNFESESAPDGSPWLRLSDATRERRMQKFGNAPVTILRASVDLMNSINVESETARCASVRPGLRCHPSFRRRCWSRAEGAHSSTAYLGLSAEDEEEISAIAEDWLAVDRFQKSRPLALL